jgi:GT2 family glycosyltransferase
MEKIGVGIITYKRPKYFSRVIETIPFDRVDNVVVVNDDPDVEPCNCSDLKYHEIINERNFGVGISKNKALKYLIEQGCTHLFLIEDDILITDPDVFDVYIKTAKRSGIWHLNFGKADPGRSKLKFNRRYINGEGIDLYHNPQGSFSYIRSNIINKLGYFDENYVNAFEHIDFVNTLIQNGLHPPFWYFADVINSNNYLRPIEGSQEKSTITNTSNYEINWKLSADYFRKKWGYFTNQIVDVGRIKTEETLNFIENNYSKKNDLTIGKKLGIIIPFRNRQNHLDQLLPPLKEMLNKQNPNHEILVIEQSGGILNGDGSWNDGNSQFNKGKLLNVGVLMAKKRQCHYVVLHDVDLVPECSDYTYPERPTHLSSLVSQFQYQLPYPELFGGVFSITVDDYFKVNGYTNNCSGWGVEDDNFFVRLSNYFGKSISESRILYGRYLSLPHTPISSIPNGYHINNYYSKLEFHKKFTTGEVTDDSGINNVEYEIINTTNFDTHTKITINI